MRNVRLLMIVAVFALYPADAHAARGFWGWLEELSGPGPFKGDLPVLSVPIGCVRDDGHNLPNCWSRSDKHIRRVIAVRFGSFTSESDRPRFDDLPAGDPDNSGEVHVRALSALYLFRVHPAVDVGAGIGFMRVSGDGFDAFSRLTLTPASVSVSPFALRPSWAYNRYAHILRIEVDTSFVPQGFKGSDFGNTRTRFDSGPEFLTRVATVIDLSVLIWP
jgi:hypothetical protein